MTTVYTVPDGGKAIVTNIVASYAGTVSAALTVRLAGLPVINAVGIQPSGVLTLDISQVLEEGDTIQVQGNANACSVHISGVEVV